MRHGHPLTATAAAAVAALALAAAAPAGARDAAQPVQIRTRDLSGADVLVPAPDRPTVLLFARVDQEQSTRASDGLRLALQGISPVQALVVISGRDAADALDKFAKTLLWPALLDPEYRVAGQLEVSAWPTTIVLTKGGLEIARLAGLGPSYVRDLNAYLAFATGAIDRATLDHRLGATGVAEDSAEQQADRHRRLAEQLLEKGATDQARAELDRGLKLAPQNPYLALLSARVALLQRDPQQALALLGTIDDPSVDARAVATLRGGALVATERADEAIPILLAVLHLNPDPGEAYYYLGAAYQQKGKNAEAAAAFRAAFEHSRAGRILAPALAPATTTTEPVR